jgi:hypothetical protein
MPHFLGLRYFRLPRSGEVTSEAADIGDGFDAIRFPQAGAAPRQLEWPLQIFVGVRPRLAA